MGLLLAVSGICCMLAVSQAEQWRWPSEPPLARSEAEQFRIDPKLRFEDSAADRPLLRDDADSSQLPETAEYERNPHDHFNFEDASNEVGEVRSKDTSGRPVLVGPRGPTGFVGPYKDLSTDSGESASAQRDFLYLQRPEGLFDPRYMRPVLVGPGGPTGIVGPRERGVLVGPGGPTGIIGPRRQGVLVGPGGPTGVIGPAGINGGYGARRPGVLVGPGGPTGMIGPGRQVLVGPGGPTGQIGPRGSYGK